MSVVSDKIGAVSDAIMGLTRRADAVDQKMTRASAIEKLLAHNKKENATFDKRASVARQINGADDKQLEQMLHAIGINSELTITKA